MYQYSFQGLVDIRASCEDLTELTATFLEREDERFVVETATGPEKGLQRLANGIEFPEAVREEYLEFPFILFTGKGSEAAASEAISAGVTDSLRKGPVPSRSSHQWISTPCSPTEMSSRLVTS